MNPYLVRLKALKAQKQIPDELPKLTKGAFVSFVSTHGTRFDVAEADERAAIVEIDGNVPAVYAGPFAQLQQVCPDGVPIPRWHQFVNDGGTFLDAWGHQAAALGWTPADLFGLHETKPLVRHDATGLLWLLKGQQVVALTSTAAKLSGGLVYRRTFRQPGEPP